MLAGDAGVDHIYGDGCPVPPLPSCNGNDTMDGGTETDFMYGGGGMDIMTGGAGDDWLWGGAGPDTINGGSGADVMWGEAGNDLVSGDAGNDRMSGGDDDDVMSGGPDDDVVCGDGESVVGDQLSDGDPDPGVDLLWANVIADMGVYCYNVSTRYDCAEVPLSGAGTCSDACLGARPIECP